MKILSLLLLLALGLGAAWWTQTHPDGTLEDVRHDVDRLVERAGPVLDRARESAVDTLGLAIGGRTDAPVTTPDPDPDESPDPALGTPPDSGPDTAEVPADPLGEDGASLDPDRTGQRRVMLFAARP